MDGDVPFKTIGLGPATEILPRHQYIGDAVLCQDEESAEAALLDGLPDVVVTGMTSHIQTKLVRMVSKKGVRILSFHGSFYGPSSVAKDILELSQLLMLPHSDLAPSFGKLPAGFLRVTGSPGMERVQMEYRMLRTQATAVASPYPGLKFLQGAHGNSSGNIVLTYFEDCSSEDEGKSKSTRYGRLLAAREEFLRAVRLFPPGVVKPAIHSVGGCPALSEKEKLLRAPSDVDPALLMSVSSVVLSAAGSERPVEALFVGSPGI